MGGVNKRRYRIKLSRDRGNSTVGFGSPYILRNIWTRRGTFMILYLSRVLTGLHFFITKIIWACAPPDRRRIVDDPSRIYSPQGCWELVFVCGNAAIYGEFLEVSSSENSPCITSF